MRCKRCTTARAMPKARDLRDLEGSAFQLCQSCALAVCPTTTEAWLALAEYRYAEFPIG